MKIRLLCIAVLAFQISMSAQTLGSKVRFKDENGKTFTGMITYINGDQYKIKYDGQELVRFAKAGEFTVITQYLMNSRVEAFKEDGSAIGRGSVVQVVSGDKYKIRFDGCFEKGDLVIKTDFLKPEVLIDKYDSTLYPLLGKWQLLAYGYPKDYKGMANNGFDPPLWIKSDGTYIWYDEFNKPAIIGSWYPYAKIEGVTEGANSQNGIILTDRTSLFWKINCDSKDHIQAYRLCTAEQREAERLK